MEQIKNAIDHIGQSRLARACGVSRQAVHQWWHKGLPRTEWTGETHYARIIEHLSGGQFLASDLLASRFRNSS